MLRTTALLRSPSTQIFPLFYGVRDPEKKNLRGVLVGTIHELTPFNLGYENAEHFFAKKSVVQRHFSLANRVILETGEFNEQFYARHGIDARFILEASVQGKQVTGFQTSQDLIECEKKAKALWATRHGYGSITASREQNTAIAIKKMIDATIAGDEKGLNAVKDLALDLIGYDADTMLYHRNALMAKHLDSLWRQEESGIDFIAVGAAHLCGERSLCAELEDYEWKVQRIPTELALAESSFLEQIFEKIKHFVKGRT